MASGVVPPYQQGYNIAEYLLEVANDPPVNLFQLGHSRTETNQMGTRNGTPDHGSEKQLVHPHSNAALDEKTTTQIHDLTRNKRSGYATTFLTQLQYLCGREWKILKRDKSLFLTHVIVASLLGVFCGKVDLTSEPSHGSYKHLGGLYFHTDITIAGFQSRVGCLFFLVSC